MIRSWEMVVVAVLLVGSFMFGYHMSSLKQDSIELVAKNAADQSAQKYQTDQKGIADNVQKSLDDWRANNTIIQKEVTHEKLQPVFNNDCVSSQYIKLFNEQTNSAKTNRAVESSTSSGN